VIIGIDSGQTSLKAVVFDEDGRALGAASQTTVVNSPHAHWVERDMNDLIAQFDSAIRDAMVAAGVTGDDISAVGIVAHGDGLYFVDAENNAVRPAILALDSRAQPVLDEWTLDGVLDRARAITGQEPFAGSLAPLVSWLRQNDPAALDDSRWLINCKDWLRLSLTGRIGTDLIEATSSVGQPDGSSYSAAALEAYGIEDIAAKLAPALAAHTVAGYVTDSAAARTGLRVGTPAVTGTHDVVGCALGIGAVSPGDLSVVVGTYSINQMITETRKLDARYQVRPWLQPGQWINMATSPASATNLEWFINTLMPGMAEPLAIANDEVAAVLADPSDVLYHPFVFGSPFGAVASASFLGLRAWHSRGHLLKALFEGVAMAHRYHLDAFIDESPRTSIRLTGGGSRSDVWCQIFADALNSRVEVAEAKESGALGAAMLAGVGTGLYESLEDAASSCVRIERIFTPSGEGVRKMDALYDTFTKSLESLKPLWPVLDRHAIAGPAQ
jgi:L-xylulokinase